LANQVIGFSEYLAYHSKGFIKHQYERALTILGLTPPITFEEIKQAYRYQVKRYHPDLFFTMAEKGVATRKIQEVNWARDYANTYFSQFISQYPELIHDPKQSRETKTEWTTVNPTRRDRLYAWDIIPVDGWMGVVFWPIFWVHMLFVVVTWRETKQG